MTSPPHSPSLDTPGPERGYYLTRTQVDERKLRMKADVWLYMQWVCQPHRASTGGFYVERFHRPLAYFLAGDAVRLAASLATFKSEVVSQLQAQLQRRNINPQTSEGIRKLKRYLRRVNDRISRAMGKTTDGLDVISHVATFNPDYDIGIASKSDPAAWEMCNTVGKIMRSDEYAMYFPERLYPLSGGNGINYDSYITQEWIMLRGGSIAEHKSIVARGINSQWYSWHGHIIYCDDLCSTEAKQGVATVEDARRFIASMQGLSRADQWGGTRHIFNGTIAGPKDDNSILVKDEKTISIRVPIWTKDVVTNVRNLMLDGTPTLPEWYSVEDIRDKRAEVLSDPQHGSLSWLQNFELTAHEAGAMSFSQELLNRSKFTWITKPARLPDGREVNVRWIRRYLWEDVNVKGADGNVVSVRRPKRGDVPDLKSGETCQCYLHCKHPDHSYVEFDPATLPRIMGCDQAFVGSGDKWSVCNISKDHFNYLYALRGRAGFGYDRMIAAIPLVAGLYGGVRNMPKKVGIESNMVQANTAFWMQRSEDVFGLLSRRITPVSPGKIQKSTRIFNNVYSAMEMGTLLTDPDDKEVDEEALAYDPSASDPDDGILDSFSIAIVLHTAPTSDPALDKKMRDLDDRMYNEAVDPLTGVDVSTDFTDYLDPWN